MPGEPSRTLVILQREHPGKYLDEKLRTFRRKVKLWRVLKGPSNEVFFPQPDCPNEKADIEKPLDRLKKTARALGLKCYSLKKWMSWNYRDTLQRTDAP